MGFDPATLAIAATIGSSAIGAVGAIQQSRAQAASAGYNAKIAAQNAQIATQNANYIGAQGEQNVAAEGAKTKAAEGAIVANQGASGEQVNTGSAVNVRESAAKVGMLNALNVRSQAARAAYGQQVQATSDIAQSQLLRSQQKADITGGYLNAGATILGGVGKAAMFAGGGGNPDAGSTDAYSNFLSQSSPVGDLTATGNTGGYYNYNLSGNPQ